MSSQPSESLTSLASHVGSRKLAGAIGSVVDYARYLRLGFLQPLDEATFNTDASKQRFQQVREQFGKDLDVESLAAVQRGLILAPISLLPAPVPEAAFNEARSLMPHFNLLMHRVAHDEEFLRAAYVDLIKVDDFQGRLWDIYEKVLKEGVTQPICLQVNRNDFMIERDTASQNFRIRQVEINLFASSFGYFAERAAKLHSYSIRTLEVDHEPSRHAQNSNIKAVAHAFVSAWQTYGVQNAAILFVVQSGERNIMDQRAIEFAIVKAEPRIRVMRRTLAQVAQHAVLDEQSKQLQLRVNVNDDHAAPIAVVYFRSGYTPRDYPDESCWQARLLIERSNAIKCPNMAYHLANSKRVQQCLFTPGAVERFFANAASDSETASIVSRIRATFVGQFQLIQTEAVDRALAQPDAYVLKPNREGGGANLFHEELVEKLKAVRNTEERFAYTLMERIRPYVFDAYLLNSTLPVESAFVTQKCCLEFGVYGVLLGDATRIHFNNTCGYLIRTKQLGVDEGGVAAGFAALDSAYLV